MGPHKLNLIVYFWLINVKGDRKGQINYSGWGVGPLLQEEYFYTCQK